MSIFNNQQLLQGVNLHGQSYPLAQKMTHSYPGWWLSHPSEKYEFVNWDDEKPNRWKNKKWQPNHQPEFIILICSVDNPKRPQDSPAQD